MYIAGNLSLAESNRPAQAPPQQIPRRVEALEATAEHNQLDERRRR